VPESHPIHASLFRPALFAGVEPAAAALEVLTAGALVFGAGFHVATILLAGFYLTGVHALMVWVAAQDPQMSELYIRSLSARDYYLAQGSVVSRILPVCPAIPRDQ
jgi:type IV secretory pathway TrbD component